MKKNFQWLGPVRSLNYVVAHVRFFFKVDILSVQYFSVSVLSIVCHHQIFFFVIFRHLISFLHCIEFNQILPNQYFASSASATSSWQWHSLSLPFIWRSCCQMSDIHVASRHIVINLSHPLKMWCLDGCNDWLANKVLSDVFITSVLSGYLLWMPNMLYQTTPLTSSMGFNSEWTEINTFAFAMHFFKILLVALRRHSGEKDTDQVFLINFRKIFLTNLLWNIQKLIWYFVTAVFVPSKFNISLLVWHYVVILKVIKDPSKQYA